MKKLGLLATCDCPDNRFRRENPFTMIDVASRQDSVGEVLGRHISREETNGVVCHTFKGSGGDKWEVYVSQVDNGDQIEWPCKHVLTALVLELQRLEYTVSSFVPTDVQVMSDLERITVDGGRLDILVV